MAENIFQQLEQFAGKDVLSLKESVVEELKAKYEDEIDRLISGDHGEEVVALLDKIVLELLEEGEIV